MPFTSKRQARKCFAMKARGQARSWNCDEWSDKTNFKKLPEKVSMDKKSAAVVVMCRYLNHLSSLPGTKQASVDKLAQLSRELQKTANLHQALAAVYPQMPAAQRVKLANTMCTMGGKWLKKKVRLKKSAMPVRGLRTRNIHLPPTAKTSNAVMGYDSGFNRPSPAGGMGAGGPATTGPMSMTMRPSSFSGAGGFAGATGQPTTAAV